jgi:DNA ligase-associated metallophosphoesterase
MSVHRNSAMSRTIDATGMANFRWHHLDLVLRHDRTLHVPAARTLLIADVHLGKPATFREAGIAVPESVTDADLDRLYQALIDTRAERLIILGDLIHARAGRNAWTHERVRAWRVRCSSLAIDLVRGNHDRSAGDPPADWSIRVVDGPWLDTSGARSLAVHLAHEPPVAAASDSPPVLAGHIHPGVWLGHQSAGCKLAGGRVRASCFWFSEKLAVLPAFGSFTGCGRIAPGPGDRVFALGPNEVAEIPIVVRDAKPLALRKGAVRVPATGKLQHP